ncbi:MAG: energy transducer TonB [Sphingomicrobium sp.]
MSLANHRFLMGPLLALLVAATAASEPASVKPKPARTVADAIEALRQNAEGKPRLLNPDQVVFPSDYPKQAMDMLEQGAAGIDLTIDPAGRVSACRIVKSSGSALLDATSCRIYQSRARFEPVAPDAPVRALRQDVSWKLGESAPSRLGWFQRMTVMLKATGEQVSCRVERSEGSDVDCWSTTPFRAQTAANHVKLAGYEPAKMVIETRFVPEGEPLQEPSSPHMLARRAGKLIVKSDGTLRSCEVLESLPPTTPRETTCREAQQHRFEQLPEAADATGIIWTWIYLEPKPAP